MTALIIELFVRLRAVKVAPPDVVQQLRSLFQSQNYQEAWRLCQAQRSFLTNVLAPALERLGRGREIVERVLMDHGVKEASALKTRVLYLSVVAVIAPMLGLLGTVQGMIMAFEVISLGGLGDPGKLAHSIGVALITTFAGLVVGIPSMFFYYFFRNQLAKITTIVEDTINELFEDVPYGELQGVKIGAALEEELKGVAAPVVTPQPAAPVRASVSTGATATAPAVVMENPKGASADMASCPKCQSLILAGSKVCPNCKAELDWV
jgi:biopolymer transport protein ExbB